jgi:signal transduction histidine kinase
LPALAVRVTARPTPLLVLRVVDFAEVAWRRGRRAALRSERRCAEAFAQAAGRVLRGSDILGHDAGTAVFVAALTTPGRVESGTALPTDCRAALARIASAMELATGFRMESGWTLEGSLDAAERIQPAIEAALARGASERERYAFFSLIGHEMRTPLTSVRGYLEALLEDEVDAGTSRSFLEVARSETLRLARFIDGMFELSLLDSGLYSLDRTCDAVPVVRSAIAAAIPSARKRRIEIAFTEPRAPAPVRIDADRLAQVVANIIDNALKYARGGGSVGVALEACGCRFAEISIEDDGPGVAAGERDAIFGLGYRSSTGGACGTGIGLAVARLILERCGGEIDVSDGSLGGACFRVRVPRADDAIQ